ncbi:DNA-binding protein [Undibacterium sp. Di24W]|uniref:DNA-binding protein n=1 Tax=Undibacterium sp. Di24W TaxID=3413033 RepID=UPI003BF4BE04
MPLRTIEEVKRDFNRAGMTIAQWAQEHGYAPYLVQQVLSKQSKCSRGKSHEIAVLLNIKEGYIRLTNQTNEGEDEMNP